MGEPLPSVTACTFCGKTMHAETKADFEAHDSGVFDGLVIGGVCPDCERKCRDALDVVAFSANGDLCVMRKTADGDHATLPATRGCEDRGDGMDPAFCVATIDIENDGGDW